MNNNRILLFRGCYEGRLDYVVEAYQCGCGSPDFIWDTFNAYSPLTLSVSMGHHRIVMYLLQVMGANPNFMDGSRTTALIEAVNKRDDTMVNILLNATNTNNITTNQSTILDVLSTPTTTPTLTPTPTTIVADPNITDAVGTSPLMYALRDNSMEIVKMLIKAGAYLDHSNDDGYTPMYLAERLDYEIMDSYVMDVFKDFQKYQLFDAVMNNQIGHIIAMSNNGFFDINARDYRGRTALFTAVRTQDMTMISVLLKLGANPDIAANDGTTPLILASFRGYKTIVETLLYVGKANAKCCDHDGEDAISEAKTPEIRDLIEIYNFVK